jgi:hypothetical protein
MARWQDFPFWEEALTHFEKGRIVEFVSVFLKEHDKALAKQVLASGTEFVTVLAKVQKNLHDLVLAPSDASELRCEQCDQPSRKKSHRYQASNCRSKRKAQWLVNNPQIQDSSGKASDPASSGKTSDPKSACDNPLAALADTACRRRDMSGYLATATAGLKRKRYQQRDISNQNANGGRWSKAEHELFVTAVGLYGSANANFGQVAAYVKTRTKTQCRTHHQKWEQKLKESMARTTVATVEGCIGAGANEEEASQNYRSKTKGGATLSTQAAGGARRPGCGRKHCPYCNSVVSANARVCHNCHNTFGMVGFVSVSYDCDAAPELQLLQDSSTTVGEYSA